MLAASCKIGCQGQDLYGKKYRDFIITADISTLITNFKKDLMV